MRVGKFIDLKGNRFDRLLVIERSGTGNTGQALWKCLCDCGKEANVLSDNLKRGKQRSCGCLLIESRITHGATSGGKTEEYKVWQEMRRRCNDEKSNNYHLYGGRGIKVCERWENSFENFLEDMGKRTSPRHSIDRIFNDEDYKPGNCRWATGSEQSINQRIRKTNTSGYKGVSWEARRNSWLAKITLNYKSIHLGNFENIEDAIKARKQAEIRYHNKPSN